MTGPESRAAGTPTSESRVERIEGELHSVRSVSDESGDILYRIVNPLMMEFRVRDVVQLVVGAYVLAIPVAFTEEVWVLAERLPMLNIAGIAGTSIVFLSLFCYFIFYEGHLRGHEWEFLKRVASAYLLTVAVAAMLLTMIDQTTWTTDVLLGVKRTILVAFPACFSATVVDSLK